jgi:hypothetical protein
MSYKVVFYYLSSCSLKGIQLSDYEVAHRVHENRARLEAAAQKAADANLLMDTDGSAQLLQLLEELKERRMPPARHYGKFPSVSSEQELVLQFYPRSYESDPYRVVMTSWTLTKLGRDDFALEDQSLGLRITLKYRKSIGVRLMTRRKMLPAELRSQAGYRPSGGRAAISQVR